MGLETQAGEPLFIGDTSARYAEWVQRNALAATQAKTKDPLVLSSAAVSAALAQEQGGSDGNQA